MSRIFTLELESNPKQKYFILEEQIPFWNRRFHESLVTKKGQKESDLQKHELKIVYALQSLETIIFLSFFVKMYLYWYVHVHCIVTTGL